MATEVKEEQPAPTTEAQGGASPEPMEEETKESEPANGNIESTENDNKANGHTEDKKVAEISELAASVKQRQRKQVERFLPSAPHSEDRTKELVIPKGQGVKLGDLDNVEFRITRTEVEDLKPLHRIIFGSAGKALTVRKNLRAFTGFDFEKDTPPYHKKQEAIGRFTIKGMKFVLQLLDLETKGERPEMEERLMDFLMNPQPSGRKSLKEAAREEKEKKKKNLERKRAAAEKRRESKQKSPKKTPKSEKSPKKSSEGKGKKRPAPSESGSGSESGSDTSDGEANTSASSSPVPSPSPVKKSKAAKSPAKAPAKKANKKKSGEPTDDDLYNLISDFVSGADLETVTMKTVIAHVFAQYPSYDLSSRKPWIKETVKQLVAAAP